MRFIFINSVLIKEIKFYSMLYKQITKNINTTWKMKTKPVIINNKSIDHF